MSPEYVVNVGRQALEMMLIVSAPVLLTALGVGLMVSLLQAVTQINEATLSFLPKLLAVATTLVLTGPWMLTMLTDYIARMLTSLPQAINGGN
ncbi:MAG: flagellar biosynthesis protein FliQ [Burkholderiaceae bacterium]|jgi:flagellar biosynthetic protein FliQ|nr:flagellar biosynthesis protein FliQ [Burkholderiaceae bacterium]